MNGLPVADLLLMAAALAGAGAVAGVIGGLFGVGGGTVLVPALFYAFSVLGVGGESNLHVAIGTSLLTIVATSWKSLATHRAHGAVDEWVLRTRVRCIAQKQTRSGSLVAGPCASGGVDPVLSRCLSLSGSHVFWSSP